MSPRGARAADRAAGHVPRPPGNSDNDGRESGGRAQAGANPADRLRPSLCAREPRSAIVWRANTARNYSEQRPGARLNIHRRADGSRADNYRVRLGADESGQLCVHAHSSS